MIENKKVLIIGNKPYHNFPITKIIDEFDNNVRCNFSVPNLNNGSIMDELAVCCHQYTNLVNSNYSLNKIIEIYDHSYSVDYIKEYFHKYKENLSKYNLVWWAKHNIQEANNYLSSIGCPHLFDAIPRTGLTIIIKKLLKNNTVFVTNFSIKEEIRHSHYVDNIYSEQAYQSEKNKKNGLPELVLN